MKILKQIIIFALLGILSVFQIIYLYSKNTKLISFYPKWTIFINNQAVSISTNQGFIAQILPTNDQNYLNIKKQSNSLIINQSAKTKDKPIDNINLFIKYCSNCFIMDLNHNIVFTERDPNEDIVLKKKVIINGYSVEKKKIIDLSQKNVKLVIFNTISEEMIAIDTNTATIYVEDFKKEVKLEMPYSASQKFTFL